MNDIRKYIEVITESEKYYDGISNKDKAKRKKQFELNKSKDDSDPNAYKPVVGDDVETEKESNYTKKYKEKFDESIKSVKNKSDETGIPYSILKKVYDRGMAAYKSGHRPGTTPQQWALARVNSFAVGGKTRQTTDKDLWDEYKGKKKTNESVGTKLGQLIDVSIGKENADLYVIRRGSMEQVGKPTKEYSKEAFAITVTEPDVLDADYLFYMFMYLHSSGYFKNYAKGSTNLVNITKDDILNINLK